MSCTPSDGPYAGSTFSRRGLLCSAAALLAFCRPAGAEEDAAAILARLEASAGGRLGVCLLDAGSGRVTGNRLDERFAMCSTFKLPLAAAVLREAEQGRLSLDERVPFGPKDIESFAPVTRAHVAEGGMTVRALAQAAQEASDNTAANLLLRRLGGPAGFTAALRSMGDRETRLDRYEPDLNLVVAGDVRDTTTPRAMAATVGRVLVDGLLSKPSSELLASWMVATRTGSRRIRAGLPAEWRAGDKAGTAVAAAMTNKCNDVAAAWLPGGRLLIVAAFVDAAVRTAEPRTEDEALLAAVGGVAGRWIAG